MKTKFITFFIILFCISSALSQEKKNITVEEQGNFDNSVYKLYPTPNMYTFIKLNTRNGQMWQVQWGIDNEYRFETILSDIPRAYGKEEKNGRFTLYSTTNTYNLILLDQIDGRVWQVQWSTKKENRGVMPIN